MTDDELLDEARARGFTVVKYPAIPPAILDEIEALVGEAQVGVGEDMLSSLTQVEQLEQPRCPQCGGQMQYKGRRPKQLVTLRGEVKIESTYYYCPVCKTGFSPST